MSFAHCNPFLPYAAPHFSHISPFYSFQPLEMAKRREKLKSQQGAEETTACVDVVASFEAQLASEQKEHNTPSLTPHP